MIRFSVREGDVTEVESDLVLLKYAQAHYGADKSVAETLVRLRLCTPEQTAPEPGHHTIIETKGLIAPTRVMFVGFTKLSLFDYNAVAEVTRYAASIVIREGLPIGHVTTTIHGVGYGLDPGESLRNLIRGVGRLGTYTGILQKVTIVEINPRRAQMLARFLTDHLAEWIQPATVTDTPRPSRPGPEPTVRTVSTARSEGFGTRPRPPTTSSEPTPHVFVAMPFSEEFEDVYEFGIYAPVHGSGYLCEHVGQAAFTGDVLHRIKDRIRTAKFVVADLTGARPNVYLEVGYAWGCGVPVIILAKQGEHLHFDVSTHRCIYYKNIIHLAKELERLIPQL